MGRAPYDAVLTHGFVLDEHGRKMSKSLGNVVGPQEIMDRHGADILRLWVVSSDFTEDLRIGPEIIKTQVDAYRKLRNTLRFLLGNLAEFDESERVPASGMPELERWVLHRLCELDRLVRRSCDDFDFPSHVRCSLQLLHGGSVGVVLRYPQGLALLRQARFAASPGGPDGA